MTSATPSRVLNVNIKEPAPCRRIRDVLVTYTRAYTICHVSKRATPARGPACHDSSAARPCPPYPPHQHLSHHPHVAHGTCHRLGIICVRHIQTVFTLPFTCALHTLLARVVRIRRPCDQTCHASACASATSALYVILLTACCTTPAKLLACQAAATRRSRGGPRCDKQRCVGGADVSKGTGAVLPPRHKGRHPNPAKIKALAVGSARAAAPCKIRYV